MLPRFEPELIIDQLKTLEDIHRKDFESIIKSIHDGFTDSELTSVHNVFAFGDGDSFHAALSAEMAFNEFSGVNYRPFPAMKFLEYGADYSHSDKTSDTIAIGISASGRTTRTIQAIKRVKQVDETVLTAGLVGTKDSLLAEAADRILSTQLPELGRSPGIRTYTASVMGLLELAISIGEQKDWITFEKGNDLRSQIIDMADYVNQTYLAALEPAKKAVQMCQHASFISFVGSGPSYGSALFSSAKIVEACGVFSVAQDLEEWAHVEQFAYPLDFPVVIVAPPGKSHWRALDLAKTVKQLGHPLIAILNENETEISEIADIVFPVIGEVNEAFSPLLYYISGTAFSYYLTKALGRQMFMSDNEFVKKLREEMQKRQSQS